MRMFRLANGWLLLLADSSAFAFRARPRPSLGAPPSVSHLWRAWRLGLCVPLRCLSAILEICAGFAVISRPVGRNDSSQHNSSSKFSRTIQRTRGKPRSRAIEKAEPRCVGALSGALPILLRAVIRWKEAQAARPARRAAQVRAAADERTMIARSRERGMSGRITRDGCSSAARVWISYRRSWPASSFHGRF